MNVLFLALDVDLLVPRGDAIHVREQVKFLAERGHRIDLVTATHDGMSGLGSNVHSHTAIGTELVVIRKCRAIVRAGQAAVVYERRLSPKIAFAVSRLSRIPFVVEVNGVEEEAAMRGRPSTSPLRPLKFRVRKRMYRAAARVVAVTDRLATHTWQLYGLPSEKVVTIPNGVDLATFAPIDAAQARRDLGLAGANWVVFVGNLVGWQGVDVLLRAAPRVVREQSDARFLLVGEGVLRPALETRAHPYRRRHGLRRAVHAPSKRRHRGVAPQSVRISRCWASCGCLSDSGNRRHACPLRSWARRGAGQSGGARGGTGAPPGEPCRMRSNGARRSGVCRRGVLVGAHSGIFGAGARGGGIPVCVIGAFL